MGASYPGALKSFTTKTNKVDLYDAAHMNAVQEEIVAIQTELGLNPKGSKTDLVTRLALALSTAGAIAQGTAFPTSPSPIAGQIFYRTDLSMLYFYGNDSLWHSTGGGASNNLSRFPAYPYGTRVYTDSSDTTGALTTANFYFAGDGTYKTGPSFKIKKISGMNSLINRIYWCKNASNQQGTLKVIAGTPYTEASGSGMTDSNTPTTWTDIIVDVSTLTNDTIYDVTLQAKVNSGVGRVYEWITWGA